MTHNEAIRITIQSPHYDEHTAEISLFWNERWYSDVFRLWRHCDYRTNEPEPTTINWTAYGAREPDFAALFAEGLVVAVALAREFDELAVGERYAGQFADVASIESRTL